MRHRRTVLATLTTFVMLISWCAPALADDPTLAERQAAQNRVTVAKRAVDALQARAEHAVEVYNGHLTAARKAALAHDAAEAAALGARTRHERAEEAAAAAREEAAQATADARATARTRDLAARDAGTAQRQLDAMAVGAYRSAGRLGMLSQLMLADDPIELANGRNLIDQVTAYQRQVISDLRVAQADAAQAAHRAVTAQDRALVAAARAATALRSADATRTAAETANHTAAVAAQTAHRALDGAHRAKSHATALVARAERALHRAVRTAASLERAAAAARRAAANVPTGKAPSNAAATAMHWAFEEIGVPYSWGGGDESGPTRGFAQGASTVGFDCSGLTLFIYAKAGIRLDHYTGSQWNQGRRMSSRKDLQPGDLMFFAYDTSNPSTIHHVSIYLGKGRMIEAPYTGEVVRVSSASRDDFIGATRPWA